jgi:hypothetical protein
LKEKFDKREDARSAISEKDEKHKKELDESLGKEKSQWLAFLPQMVKAITFAEKAQDSSEMVSAQAAGRALLTSLQLKGYVTEAYVNTLFLQREKALATALKKLEAKYAKKEDPAIKDAVDLILKQANKIPGGAKDPLLKGRTRKAKTGDGKPLAKETTETDPMLNSINTLTRRLKNIIEKATKDLIDDAKKPVDIEKNNEIYKSLVTTEKIFTKIRKWFDTRETLIDELDDPEKFMEKEEVFWLNHIPTFLHAITYTDLNEDPDDVNVKAMAEEQKQGKEFLEYALLDIGYVTQEKLDKKREVFEKNLAGKIEKEQAADPAGIRLGKIRDKLPGGAQIKKLKDAKFKP